VSEAGAVTRAVLLGSRDADQRALAERLCRACVDGLDVDGAAVSVLTARTARTTLFSTDTTADLLEELQFSLNDGACIEAATSGAPVMVSDMHHGTETERWPAFAAAVAERATIGALFALPLQWGAVNVGVLDLYRARPGGLTVAGYADLLRAVDIVALLVIDRLTVPREAAGREDADGWPETSSATHYEVHQATGMVLAQLGVDPVVALARMRAHAFAEQRLLVEIARDVVARRLRFTEDMS
jgi:hypothetical protein